MLNDLRMTLACAAVASLAMVSGTASALAQSAEDLNNEGLAHYSAKLYQKAIDSFDQAMKLDPENATVRSNLAIACHAHAMQQEGSGATEQAIETERRAFELDGTNPVFRIQLAAYYNNYGRKAARTGDVARAMSLLSEAIKLQPDNGIFVTNMCTLMLQEARNLQKKGENEKALQLLGEAEKTDPGNSTVPATMGELYYLKNDYASALRSFERALAINPFVTNASLRLAQIRKEKVVEKDFDKNDRSRFIIKYESGVNEDLSWNVSGMLDDAYREIGQKLECWPTAPMTVIIYSKEQFTAVTSAPDWAIGRFDGKLRICVSDFTKEKDALKSVVRHEYTHALVFDLYGNKVPLWINEGLAQYASSSDRAMTDNEKAIFQGIGEGKIVPPWTLNDSFNSTNQAEVVNAYLESKFFMKYMFDRYGNQVARQFVHENAKGTALDQITASMFNMPPERLYEEWLAELKKQIAP